MARNLAVDGTRLEVAKSRRELEEVTARGNIAFLHAVEGGHSLEENAANAQKFFDLGVSSLTLAHFYFNGVASPVDGVPKKMKPPFCFRRKKDLSKGLELLGRDVVEEMVRLGMLIDMTHCTPLARERGARTGRSAASSTGDARWGFSYEERSYESERREDPADRQHRRRCRRGSP